MALDPISVVLEAVDRLSPVLKAISEQAQNTQKIIDGLKDSAENFAAGTNQNLGKLLTNLAGAGTAFLGLKTAFDAIAGAASGFYEAAIASNEQLNAQLLTSQTNLASAARIFKDGVEITNVTDKIKATRGSLDEAIKTIQKETQSLVGVTSGQVNELFQITLQNAADLNNQAKGLLDDTGKDISKKYNDPIMAATKLTKGWAAGLKVVGIPLASASQEINSIIKGQIDVNSTLAKNLKITNEEVNQWKAQGKLITELDKRLKTFVAGNAIAANSIDGIMSNIQDYWELFAKEVGKPLLQPVIDALNDVFKVIDDNKDFIFGFLNKLGAMLGSVIGGALKALIAVLSQAFQGLVNLLQSLEPITNAVGSALATAFDLVAAALAPVWAGLQAILNSPIGGFITQAAALATVFVAISVAVATILPLLTAVGAAITGVVGSLGIFSGVIGSITGLFGLLGGAISGVFGFVATLVTGLGGLGGLLASIGGALTGFGSAIVGAFAAIPGLLAAIPAGLGAIGGAIAGVLGAAFGMVATFITSTLPAFVAAAAPVIAVVAAIGAAFGVVVAILSQVPALFAPILEPAGKLLKTIQILAGAILGGLFSKLGPVLSAVGTGLQWLAGIIGTVLVAAFKLVQQVAFGFFDGLGKFIGWTIGNIQKVLAGLVDNPAFKVLAKTLGINIDQVKKALDDLNKAQAESTDKQKEADKANQDSASGLQFKAKALNELGTAYKQLQEKAANAQRAIDNEGGGDPTRFIAAAKELIQLTQKQVDLGQISQAEAEKRLNSIANNSKIEVDTQLAARDAIAKLREKNSKDELADLDNQIKAVEASVKTKEITEAEGARRIGNLKKQKLDQQLKDLTDAIASEEDAIKRGNGSKDKLEELQRKKADLETQRKTQSQATTEEIAKAETEAKKKQLDIQKTNLDAQLVKVEAALAAGSLTEEQAAVKTTAIKKQQLAIQLQDIQAQIAQAQAAKDPKKVAQLQAEEGKIQAEITKQGIEGQKQIFAAKLKDFEEKEKRATDVVKTSEAERRNEIDKQVAAGLITREKAESKKLALQQDSIKREIEAERKKIAIVEAMQATTPEAQKRKDELLIASRQRLAELNGQLIQGEIHAHELLVQAQEKAHEKQLKAIEQESKAQQNQFTTASQALEAQSMLWDGIGKSMDQQQKLLQARQQLMQSTTEMMQSQYSLAIEMLESSGDKQGADRLRLEAKAAEIKAMERQFAMEELSLDLEQKKAKILLEQEKIRLRIQQIEAASQTAQAQADLAKVKSDKTATKEDIEAAQLKLNASQMKQVGLQLQSNLLNEQASAQDDLFSVQRRNLKSKQGDQMLKARAEYAKLTPDKGDDRAIANEALGAARNNQTQLQNGGDDLSKSLKDRMERLDKTINQYRGTLDQMVGKKPGTAAPAVGADIHPSVSAPKTEKLLETLIRVTQENGAAQLASSQKASTVNINGTDPNKAADLATKRTLNALTKALSGV